jgi:hypothetical protein
MRGARRRLARTLWLRRGEGGRSDDRKLPQGRGGTASRPGGLLVLVINVEAGRLGAVSQNSNGTVDIGPMRVNDTWVPKIAHHWRASTDAFYQALLDSFCANVEGGAWILRQALDEAQGSLWEGVALYHSHAPIHKLEYMRLVYAQAMRLKREAIREIAIADARPEDR